MVYLQLLETDRAGTRFRKTVPTNGSCFKIEAETHRRIVGPCEPSCHSQELNNGGPSNHRIERDHARLGYVRALNVALCNLACSVFHGHGFDPQSLGVDVAPTSQTGPTWAYDYHPPSTGDDFAVSINSKGATHVDDRNCPLISEAVQQGTRGVSIDTRKNNVAILDLICRDFVPESAFQYPNLGAKPEIAGVPGRDLDLTRDANITAGRPDDATDIGFLDKITIDDCDLAHT